MSEWTEQLLTQLRHDEGCRLESYQDRGDLSIGYGHNISRRGIAITKEQAEALLYADVLITLHDLDRLLPWWRQQPEDVRLILANMAFNLGVGGLTNFRKMLLHVQAGEYQEAAEEMRDSAWYDQVGTRAERLARQMEGV